MKILLNWFKINSMKPNPKKFQFMILGKGSRLPVILNINNIKIRESQKVIFLGLTIDNCLTFKDHIDTLCRNASCKLHALWRLRPSVRTTYYGTNSVLFKACQVWSNLPLPIKQSQSLLEFKTNIKI